MSDFKVEVVKIAEVSPHPNGERLEIVKIVGMAYSVIAAKGNFTPGDLAFYFPVDSVIPDEFVQQFGIAKYYSKKLRAAKLRGIFSEGLLIPVDNIEDLTLIAVGHGFSIEDFFKVGDDYTEYFGCTKYEYPIPTNMGGDPEGAIGQYRFPSPEHLKRYPDIFTVGEQIYISEKVHGTNFTIMVETNGLNHVGSHNYFWKIDSEANKSNVYVRIYKENISLQHLPPESQVWGEIYGVQDLKYGCSNGTLGYVIFAVSVKGEMLSYKDFLKFCADFDLPIVPTLYVGPYRQGLADEWNNVNSVLHSSSIMEGIIIQPLIERSSPEVGRVCMKRISDKYLLRKEGSELH